MRLRFLFILSFLFSFSSFGQTDAFEDSLLRELPAANDTMQVKIYQDLCWHYIYSNTKKAVSYGQQGAAIVEEMDWDKGRAGIYNRIGVGYDVLDEIDSALYYYDKALEAGKKIDNPMAIAGVLNNIGMVQWHMSNYEEALKRYYESLRIFEEKQDSSGIGNCLNNIALIHYDMDETEQSLEMHRKALKMRKAIGEEHGIAASLGNIGFVLYDLGELDSALIYIAQSAKIKKKINDQYGLMITYKGLGVSLCEEGKFDEGFKYQDTALTIAKQLGVQYEKASIYHNIAAKYKDLGRWETALAYVDSSKQAVEDGQFLRFKWLNAKLEARVLGEMGQYKKALIASQLENVLRDSIFSEEKNRQLKEMEFKYETEKKESENELLRQQTKIIQLEADQNRTLLWGSIGLLIILAIGTIFYISAQRAKQESKLQEELIRERDKGLKAIITATEEERKRIAKDLHDGIGQQLIGLKLAWEKHISDSKQEGRDTNQLQRLQQVLDQACVDVRHISHEMMPKALSEMGLVPAIQDMLSKSLGPGPIRYRFEHFHANQRFEESVEISLYRICQELINNVIKHSMASEVSVQLFRNKQWLILVVEDNGKGIKEDKKSDGIGLMNISGRLNTINGDVNLEPGPQSGMIATIRVPLK